jgi:excisionase family DNA binding protein
VSEHGPTRLVVVADSYLTRRELAAHLHVSPKTIARMQAEGMPFERWGHRLLRYRLDRVQAWLEQRKVA